MMRFTSLASSSKGNAYLVQADGVAPLLLEAGLPIKKLREGLNFGLSGLAGCLVSHEHLDHAKAVKDLLKGSVDCYMSAGTAKALEVVGHYRVHRLTALRPIFACPSKMWQVTPFALKHDAAEPLGFIVSHKDDRLLFIPDTAYVRNRFEGITILAIECNHVGEILSENIRSGGVPAVAGSRVRHNHMSLGTLIDMIKANDLSQCRQIHLLHLSDANSDEAQMIKEVQAATGVPTYAAE